MADAIRDVKTRIKHCSVCYNLTESDPCNICSDPARDQGLVCIVEQPKDLLALESTGLYRGVYHVLLGRIAPLEDVHPEDVTVDALMQRLAKGEIRELIMGTNPNLEGDGTALHIQNVVASRFPNVQVTRLARGCRRGATSNMPIGIFWRMQLVGDRGCESFSHSATQVAQPRSGCATSVTLCVSPVLLSAASRAAGCAATRTTGGAATITSCGTTT